MSSVYASEPTTSGRIIIETTHGPLDIQLWCRECPAWTKLFLQLCLDGFYDDMIFHRISPKFIIQTGLIRQPQDRKDHVVDEKQMKQYRTDVMNADHVLDRRKYEVHSRLRFSHRGLVAMALGVDDDKPDYDVLPQFFVTLEEASFLDGKHVVFGTCSGPTVFNALRIGGVDVDETTNQPTDLEHAPRITSIRIVDNPLHQDIAPKPIVPWKPTSSGKGEDALTKKRKNRKGKLDVNVLSFGDEVGDGDGDALLVKSTSKKRKEDTSSGPQHIEESESQSMNENESGYEPSKRYSDPSKKSNNILDRARQQSPSHESFGDKNDSKESGDGKMEKIKFRPKSLAENDGQRKAIADAEKAKSNKEESEKVTGSKNDKKGLSIVEMRKAKYASARRGAAGGGRKNKKQREADTMDKLFAFKSKVKEHVSASSPGGGNERTNSTKDNSLAARMARRAQGDDQQDDDNESKDIEGYYGQVLEENDYKDDGPDRGSWLKTRFKCRRHIDHGARESATTGGVGSDGRNMDDYEVVDERSTTTQQNGSGNANNRGSERNRNAGSTYPGGHRSNDNLRR